MSKAPKAKKSALHYQPYQSTSEVDGPSMDLGMTDLPLQLDPVLTNLSSNMSRNLWEDWNENDANFGIKFDISTDEVSSENTTSPMPSLHQRMQNESSLNSYDEQQNASLNMVHVDHSHILESSEIATMGVQQKSQRNVQRSLSEDIVNMLDDNNDTTFSKQLVGDHVDQCGHMQDLTFNSEENVMGFQHPQSYLHQQPSNHMQQFQQQQLQMQQQLQQQHQHSQQGPAGLFGTNFMNNFDRGNQISAVTSASAYGSQSDSLNYLPSRHDSKMSTTLQHISSSHVNDITTALGPQASSATNTDSTIKTDTAVTASSGNNETNGSNSSHQSNSFGPQEMMMNSFLMYSMMGGQGMNMMGMPVQMPMAMHVNGINALNGPNSLNNPISMSGMPFAVQMQLQFQMQMAQMAHMNGMSFNGMHMPMSFAGYPTSLNMQMPSKINLQQQVNPQSGQGSDVDMTPIFPTGIPSTGGVMLNQTRPSQPKGAGGGGPGFVSIARKPEKPEISSILKSLMNEEAKKKEKKLERNRDSARESRRKQQTYVETLENGIKRLQLNRELVRTYQWGVGGPALGHTPCPNSPHMIDWKKRVEVVAGRTEAFESIQNPANFQSLMRLNRQRCTLAMQHETRERAVWKCFVVVGRQLAAMRTRVLQVLILHSLSENPVAMELDTLLNLTAEQKRQLQFHTEQTFRQEVLELTKLFKIFFVLRNQALRLNMLSPLLERNFREACSVDQLQNLLQWTETHHSVIETLTLK